ncbi:hypothetical protein KQI42_19040 [Tissierella sp. MSJ-40]|uniref:Uncharacterized protein n=1 Tax=Tissierella simiarum TaxID=2841534 RepID=A0ABS6ED41_9FIRM|nr:hypothetical protein [Tissierella simiarum]MBU5440093.1 hypothetical protein [Tissierella simiarum]
MNEINSNKVIEVMDRWNRAIIYDKPFAYITPSFIGKYEYAILPVPSYYYDEYINIYEKLPLNKISEEEEFKKYDILMCSNNTEGFKGDSTNTSIDNNAQINYEIYYRYSRKHFCKADLKGIIF